MTAARLIVETVLNKKAVLGNPVTRMIRYSFPIRQTKNFLNHHYLYQVNVHRVSAFCNSQIPDLCSSKKNHPTI